MSLVTGVPVVWQLTVNGVDCHDHAWQCLDADLLRPSVEKRVSNEAVSGVAGKRPQPTFADEQTELLEFLFTGNCDPDGTPVADAAAQLQDNFDEFAALVANADGDANNCLTAVLTGPNATYSGLVQVSKWRPGRGLFEAPAALTLVLPYGPLTPTGS